LNVTHKQSQAGKTYAAISSITPLPAAMRAHKPAPVLDNLVFDLDDFNAIAFETFHEKLKEHINNSIERKGGTRSTHAPSKGHAERELPVEDEFADIPF